MPTPPIPNFHGRTAELAQLRRLFEECAARDPATSRFGGPRMAVVIAESGIGKSRLVQALYQQLTTDLLWDPPEVNYWPDAFMDAGVQLRVTPNMTGHVAQGPPRFAWLGARFHATDIRNLSERRSSLTELRHSIMTHAEILRAHGSAWADATGRIKHAIARDSVGETISQVADAAVPFGGLLAKLVAGGVKLVLDRTAERKSVEDASDEASKTLVDDVEESMRSLLDGKGGLPSILWLDDAQWIDAETQELLYRVWRIARERGWPLLVVVTHWERPWRELRRQADGERGLVSFEGQPGVSIIELQDAEPDALRSYLMLQMPGLTPDQQSLMLEKAAGNFLTMVENVGQLLRVPANFVERRTTGALCPAGERVVREWQSERHKRVEQNFTGLAPEVQDLLGWSSHLGMSFLHEVVEDFADQVAGHARAAALLQECVDPLVILGRPNDLLREFRDRAFHDVAKHYFANYGQEHAAPLEAILREHLAEWVNNSFTDDGQWINDGRERSAMTLPTGERRDFLGMAVSALRPSATDLWEEPQSIVWLRAMYLLVITDREESLWNRVQQHGKELTKAQVNWDTVPQSGLFYNQRQWLAHVMTTAGALECALALWKADHGRTMMTNLGIPECRRDVVTALAAVADIEAEFGDLKGALARYEEGLEICRALVVDLGTPESRREVSVSLIQVAGNKQALGDIDGALARYEEGLEIRRALQAELGTTESRRDVRFLLACVAGIEQARDERRSALVRYKECLEIDRALMAELETPQSRRDVSVSLIQVADMERALGDLDSALAHCEEGLDIRRALQAELGTPQSRRDVSLALNRVAWTAQARGDLKGALAHCEEGLEIRRALVAELGTPHSRRDMSFALENVARIEHALGNLNGALAHYEEGLDIRRALQAELGTPESRREVVVSLDHVARIEQERGDLDSALAHFGEALEISRALMAELGTPSAVRDLDVALYRIAQFEQARGLLTRARLYYGEIEDIRIYATSAAAREQPLEGALGTWLQSLKYRAREVMKLYTGLGDGYLYTTKELSRIFLTDDARVQEVVIRGIAALRSILQSGGTDATAADSKSHPLGGVHNALTDYEEGLKDRRNRMAKLETPQSRSEVCLWLVQVAKIEQARGDLEGALFRYEEGLKIRRALKDELGTPESRRDVSVLLDCVARIEQERGDLDGALARYKEALNISRALWAELGTPQSRGNLRTSLHNVGSIEQERGDLGSALVYYKEELEIRRALMTELGTPESRGDVSWSLNQVAGIEQACGDLDGALTHYNECLEIDRALMTELGTPERRRTVSRTLESVASIEEARGELDTAIAHYKESLEIERALAAEFSTPESRDHLSAYLTQVACLEETHGDLLGALAHHNEALHIRRALVTELATPDARRAVDNSLFWIALIEEVRGNIDSALAHFKECLEINRDLLTELGTPERRRDVSNALENVAILEEAHGDLIGALAHHDEALQIRRALMAELGKQEMHRDVSISLTNVANIEQKRGDLDGALARYEEALEIQRQLSENLSTSDSPNSFNDLVCSAQLCASIEISLSRPDAALIRLESFVEQATILESATDANTLDTAATFWERHTEALDALGRSADAAISRARALALRARIADMGSD